MRARREYNIPELYRYFLDFYGVEAKASELYKPKWLKSFNRIETVVTYVRKAFPDARDVKIGDFGCGSGMISRPLADLGYHVIAIDTDKGRIDSLKEYPSNGRIDCFMLNIEDFDYPEGSLDAALAVELVEHCAYPELITEKIFRFVKPGGILIITTPNGSRLGARLLLRLPSLKQVRGMKSRETLEARQFGTDEHVLRIKLKEFEALAPKDSVIIERGYFGVSGVLFNRLTYFFLRILPLKWVVALTRTLPRIPLINSKTASKAYVVLRKRQAGASCPLV